MLGGSRVDAVSKPRERPGLSVALRVAMTARAPQKLRPRDVVGEPTRVHVHERTVILCWGWTGLSRHL